MATLSKIERELDYQRKILQAHNEKLEAALDELRADNAALRSLITDVFKSLIDAQAVSLQLARAASERRVADRWEQSRLQTLLDLARELHEFDEGENRQHDDIHNLTDLLERLHQRVNHNLDRQVKEEV